MIVETDADRLVMVSDWGVSGQLKRAGRPRKTVKGIFDEAYAEIDAGGTVGFATASPRFVCRSCDICGAEDADTITIGSDVFNIRVLQPDGTGMTELVLEKQ